MAELAKHTTEIALIFSTAALALVGAMFALFIRPKLKDFEKLQLEYKGDKARIDTWKIPTNLEALQAMQQSLAELNGREMPKKLDAQDALLRDVVKVLAALKQSEAERNQRLLTAIDTLTSNIAQLESEIAKKVARGDRENQRRLMEWRIEQLETKYTLSRIQGGIQEERARDEWHRAKDDLVTAFPNPGNETDPP